MDDQYSKLFDLSDDPDNKTEEIYHKIIPMIDTKVFRQVLQDDIDIINKSDLGQQQWAKFKYGLLMFEKLWDIEIFKWNVPPINLDYPYISIGIIWDQLKNKSSRYFQVHLALENKWTGKNELSNIWEYIDDILLDI